MKNQVSSFIRKSIWVAIALFALRCAISFKEIMTGTSMYGLWSFAGEAISVTMIIMIVYEKWLWKYDPFVKTPKLFNEYEGILISSYDGVERHAVISIKQTLLSVEVILKTDESKSKAISASIENILGEYQLTYSYLNTPVAGVRDRSAVHYGTAMLCVDNPKKIEGTYFTDRKTIGDMRFNAQQNS